MAMQSRALPHDAVTQLLPFIYFKLPQVIQAVGQSQSWIYERIKKGEFPKGDLIGAQSRRWKSTDIADWLTEQAARAELREDELAARLKRKAQIARASVTQKREVGHAQA